MTVGQLTNNISSTELSEWLAFDRIEPLDNPYWRSGMVASVLASSSSGKKYTPQDFMPHKKKEQTVEEQKAILNLIAKRG